MNTFETIHRLTERIVRGQAIFFIGAGCSIDAERNTARRLMIRLLIQFKALVNTIQSHASLPADRTNAGQLELNLTATFALRGNAADSIFPWTTSNSSSEPECDVNILATRYYEANDWFVAAFDRLLISLAKVKSSPDLLDIVFNEAERIRAHDKQPLDAVPMCRVRADLVQWAELFDHNGSSPRGRLNASVHQGAGKMLFLDSLGFADSAIMGGSYEAQTYVELASAYGGKLFPRFHVLARLAREGYCPIVLTTNYDLLIEGAWRMAGFAIDGSSEATSDWRANLDVPYATMARIGKPIDFVEHGSAYRRSLVVKMHGCADAYRRAAACCQVDQPSASFNPKDNAKSVRLRKYLRSMVFTYREIQNWRQDSWMRDYLATLLRTRTVVFSGYSLQDPVIHDSFRTVYEDISRYAYDRDDADTPRSISEAPAFYFDPIDGDKCSFHGNQVLNAASRGIGAFPEGPGEHVNQLKFHFRGKPEFPNLDELFVILFHLTQRATQAKLLRKHLVGVTASLLSHRPRNSEVELLIDRFERLLTMENDSLEAALSAQPGTASTSRRGIRQLTSWTYDFHPALLGEFACADLIFQQRGPSVQFEKYRTTPWYFPATARPAWTAWAVVVELALRQLLVSASNVSGDVFSADSYKLVYPHPGQLPSVNFRRATPNGERWEVLALEAQPVDIPLTSRKSTVQIGKRTLWTLAANQSPWPKPTGAILGPQPQSKSWWGDCLLAAPPASCIWSLALGLSDPHCQPLSPA